MKSLTQLTIGLALTFACLGSAHAAQEFNGVNDLNAIKADYYKLGTQPNLKLDGERNGLQREATAIIQKMPVTGKKLSDAQIKAMTELLSIAEPVDPAHAMIENNQEIIKANLPKFKSEISKLPKAEQESILSALETVLD